MTLVDNTLMLLATSGLFCGGVLLLGHGRLQPSLTFFPSTWQIFTKTKLVQRILQGMEEPQTNGESSEPKRYVLDLQTN